MKQKDIEAEEEVLALMLRKHAKHGIKTLLPDDFKAASSEMKPAGYTQFIFKKIRETFTSIGDGYIHPKTVEAAITSSPEVGDPDRYKILINRLMAMNIEAEHDHAYFHHKCEELKLYSKNRYLVDCAQNLGKYIALGDTPSAETEMRKYLENIARFEYGSEEATIIDYKQHYQERLSKVMAGDKHEDVILTGCPPIDDNSGGIRRGELVVILARTSGGKSVWKQDLAANLVQLGYKVAYFSKEDSAEAVSFRLDSRFTEIEHLKFRRSLLNDADHELWQETIDSMPDNRLKIICMGRKFTPTEVRKLYMQLYNTGFEPDVVICDYIGIMSPSHKAGGGAKWEKMDSVVQELKEIAVELDVPLITSAQIVPGAYQEDKIGIEDIAYGKLAVSAHADQIFGFIMTDIMKSLGVAKIQMIKGRSSGINQETYDVEPQMNVLTVNKFWKLPQGKFA